MKRTALKRKTPLKAKTRLRPGKAIRKRPTPQGREEGARDMRERAARSIEWEKVGPSALTIEAQEWNEDMDAISARIAALPLNPAQPGDTEDKQL